MKKLTEEEIQQAPEEIREVLRWAMKYDDPIQVIKNMQEYIEEGSS